MSMRYVHFVSSSLLEMHRARLLALTIAFAWYERLTSQYCWLLPYFVEDKLKSKKKKNNKQNEQQYQWRSHLNDSFLSSSLLQVKLRLRMYNILHCFSFGCFCCCFFWCFFYKFDAVNMVSNEMVQPYHTCSVKFIMEAITTSILRANDDNGEQTFALIRHKCMLFNILCARCVCFSETKLRLHRHYILYVWHLKHYTIFILKLSSRENNKFESSSKIWAIREEEGAHIVRRLVYVELNGYK